MLLDVDLRDFPTCVEIICAFQTGHRLSSEEACNRIKKLWKSLNRSKHNLHIRTPDTTY